jgi:hypothetical protein
VLSAKIDQLQEYMQKNSETRTVKDKDGKDREEHSAAYYGAERQVRTLEARRQAVLAQRNGVVREIEMAEAACQTERRRLASSFNTYAPFPLEDAKKRLLDSLR